MLKSVFLRTYLIDKINSSKNLQKQPHQFAAVRKGCFCKFLDEFILSSTFLNKTDFIQYAWNHYLAHIIVVFSPKIVTCPLRRHLENEQLSVIPELSLFIANWQYLIFRVQVWNIGCIVKNKIILLKKLFAQNKFRRPEIQSQSGNNDK